MSMPELHLDPRATALVLIDMQKSILSMATAPHSASMIVREAACLGRCLHWHGGTVVRVRVAYASTYADKLNQPIDRPDMVPPDGLPPDWAEFAPEIKALPADVEITKRQWGAFYGTELDLQLRRRGVTTIILGGLVTNMGVESTAREVWEHHYAVVVAEDACTGLTADLHRFSVENILPHIARVRSTRQVVAALGSMPASSD